MNSVDLHYFIVSNIILQSIIKNDVTIYLRKIYLVSKYLVQLSFIIAFNKSKKLISGRRLCNFNVIVNI